MCVSATSAALFFFWGCQFVTCCNYTCVWETITRTAQVIFYKHTWNVHIIIFYLSFFSLFSAEWVLPEAVNYSDSCHKEAEVEYCSLITHANFNHSQAVSVLQSRWISAFEDLYGKHLTVAVINAVLLWQWSSKEKQRKRTFWPCRFVLWMSCSSH